MGRLEYAFLTVLKALIKAVVNVSNSIKGCPEKDGLRDSVSIQNAVHIRVDQRFRPHITIFM